MDEQWNDWSRASRLPLSTRPGAFAAWRRELSERIGWFDERFLVAGDKEFWHRLATKVRVGLIPKVLYLYNAQSRVAVSRRAPERALAARESAAQRNATQWPVEIRRRIRFIRVARALMPVALRGGTSHEPST